MPPWQLEFKQRLYLATGLEFEADGYRGLVWSLACSPRGYFYGGLGAAFPFYRVSWKPRPTLKLELEESPLISCKTEESSLLPLCINKRRGLHGLLGCPVSDFQVVLYEADLHGKLWIRLGDLQTAVTDFLNRLG